MIRVGCAPDAIPAVTTARRVRGEWVSAQDHSALDLNLAEELLDGNEDREIRRPLPHN